MKFLHRYWVFLLYSLSLISEFQRRIKISKMKALSKSTQSGNLEFVVHVKDEYDYRFVCDTRDELFE